MLENHPESQFHVAEPLRKVSCLLGACSPSWTTSRLPYFVEMLRDSLFEAIEAKPEWQVYHPLTPLADIHHLRSGLLVCIAGRVIEPPTQTRQGKLGSDHV